MSRAEGRGVRAGAKAAARSSAKTAARGAVKTRKADPGSGAVRMLNIGHGNLMLASRVVAIVSPNASPMRRLREEAAERNKLVDATMGRRTRSILITDSDHVILCAVNPETIAQRLAADEAGGAS